MESWKARYKALFAIGLLLAGSILAGVAYTEPILGPGFGTLAFCLGTAAGCAGIIYLIKILVNKTFNRS